MTATPSTLDVQAAATAQALGGVHTCMPAEVVRVHGPETPHRGQFVDVQPSLRRLAYDDLGDLVQESLPVLHMVPVAHMSGGGFYVAVPLAVGDSVTLVFAERSLDVWLEVSKPGSAPVDQGDVGTHTLAGAIALPCGPQTRPTLHPDVSGSDLVVAGPSGVLARFTADGDVVFAEGDIPLALANSAGDELDRIKSDLETLKAATSTGFAACQPKPATPPVEPKLAFETVAATVPSSPGSIASEHIRGR